MIKRRVVGLVLFCLGVGMLLVLTLPVGVFLVAVVLTAAGFYLLTRRC